MWYQCVMLNFNFQVILALILSSRSKQLFGKAVMSTLAATQPSTVMHFMNSKCGKALSGFVRNAIKDSDIGHIPSALLGLILSFWFIKNIFDVISYNDFRYLFKTIGKTGFNLN